MDHLCADGQQHGKQTELYIASHLVYRLWYEAHTHALANITQCQSPHPSRIYHQLYPKYVTAHRRPSAISHVYGSLKLWRQSSNVTMMLSPLQAQEWGRCWRFGCLFCSDHEVVSGFIIMPLNILRQQNVKQLEKARFRGIFIGGNTAMAKNFCMSPLSSCCTFHQHKSMIIRPLRTSNIRQSLLALNSWWNLMEVSSGFCSPPSSQIRSSVLNPTRHFASAPGKAFVPIQGGWMAPSYFAKRHTHCYHVCYPSDWCVEWCKRYPAATDDESWGLSTACWSAEYPPCGMSYPKPTSQLWGLEVHPC